MKYLLLLSLLLFGFFTASAQSEEPVNDLPSTVIEWEEKTFEFGVIKEGAVAEHTYWVKNTGNNPLKIYNVKPSCGCTIPDWTKDEIPPGGKGLVKLSFDSKGKSGIQKKSVSVTTNTEPRTTVLGFGAEVIPGTDDGTDAMVEDSFPLPPIPDPVQFTDSAVASGDSDTDGNAAMEIAETEPLPVFSFTEEHFDFGRILEGEVVTHEFVFTNTGNADLIIENVKPSCGCTTPDWTKEPILPGEQGSIKVQFDSKGKSGMQKKSVTVTANTQPRTKVINFQGDVQTEPKGMLMFDQIEWVYPVKGHKTLKKEFAFTNEGDGPLTLTGAESSCACIKAEIPSGAIAPGARSTVTITFTRKGCKCGEDYPTVFFNIEGSTTGPGILLAPEAEWKK